VEDDQSDPRAVHAAHLQPECGAYITMLLFGAIALDSWFLLIAVFGKIVM